MQNDSEMKTPTFAIMEQSDDVDQWRRRKNSDFKPQNMLFEATDFHIFTAQSMLKSVHYRLLPIHV